MADLLGIIGGSGFLEGPLISGLTEASGRTEFGEVPVFLGDGFVLLLRHGHGGVYRPPHRIPHRAHVLAFDALGVTSVIGFNSIGSLSRDIAPGTAVVPDDYLSIHPPPSFARDERLHIVPRLDDEMRSLLLAAAESTSGPLVRSGVYVETRGPRFETPAEIRWLATLGDVVGMTAASEATLFQEKGIGYANLGIVDNFANGLGVEPLSFELYERMRKANEDRTRQVLEATIRIRRGKETE